MKLTAWRAALRIARRDALRAKGRSALVLAMIALPVLGVAGADVVYRSAQLSPQQQAARLMGGSDALVSLFARGSAVLQAPNASEGATGSPSAPDGQPTAEQQKSNATEPAELIRKLLPAGSTLIPLTSGTGALAGTRDGELRVETAEADLTDPVWRGRINVVHGRAPSAPGEIAATGAFLDRSGLKVGDTTTVRGLEGAPFTITAAVEYPGQLAAIQLVARPGELVTPLARASGPGNAHDDGTPGGWLVRLPAGTALDWAGVQEIDKYGFTATSRSVLLNPPSRAEVPYYLMQDRLNGRKGGFLDQTTVVLGVTVAGMALLEVVLLAGPAFAIGARRSRRQLGLLAAGGGDRSHIRAVVLGGGMVLGLAGAALGVILAIGLVVVGRPQLEQLAEGRFGSLGLHPLDLAAIALLGLVTGLLAAIVPALQAARQDVLAALTGRDSLKPASRGLALTGLLMVAGGAALAVLGATGGFVNRSTAVLGGSAVAELGMVALTPMLVGLMGRLGRLLPLSPRLALRDAVRHRGRTAPAVAAVMAAVAGSVAVGIYGASTDAQNRQAYVAALPSGGVQLFLGWDRGKDTSQLPQLRAAVEQSMPALGARGDVYETGYPNGCAGDGCGYVQAVPPEERRCPATEQSLSARPLDPAEFARVMREDPRCANRPVMAGSYFGMVPAGDATALHNLFGVQDRAAAQALTDGKVVVFDPRYLKDGKVVLRVTEALPARTKGSNPAAPPLTHEITADAVVATPAVRTATAFLSPQTAQRLGLATAPAGTVWLPDSAPSSSAEQRAVAAVGTFDPGVQLDVERGYRTKNDLVGLGLTGFAALVALGAAGIATGLASADSQRDLATLAAVGAGGGIRRRLSGFQCGVIAAAGTVLGTVSGFVPAVALRKFQQANVTPEMARYGVTQVLAIPWLNIGLTLVVLPLVAVLLAMLLTRSRITLTRRAS